MRRALLLSNFLLLITAWILASQVWASGVLVDTEQIISVTAVEAYPQVTIVLVVWALLSIFTRYFTSFFSKFLFTAITVLLFATVSPMWFDSAAGSLNILKPQITKLTGIADWNSAMSQLATSFYDHTVADFFVIVLVLGLVSTLARIWLGSAKPDGGTTLTTRIDKLPKW
jgi:hypothetical protein